MKSSTDTCGCCEGIDIITPQPTVNRPGLSALSYRIGTHASFLETMLARLSSSDYPALAELRTRAADDPAIALLDAWAVIADVLTFYNERLANEGYLRTATERRSILELARLVGYKLRPGVASSVYLAYSLDDNFKEETIIPKGARSQSVPGPGELPQSFEISEDLKARAKWNSLTPRLTRPQSQASITFGNGTNQRIYLKGINTNLKPNDPLLIDYADGNPVFERVKDVKPNPAANHTEVILQSPASDGSNAQEEHKKLGLIGELTRLPSLQPANSLTFKRNLRDQFGRSDFKGLQDDSVEIESRLRGALISGEASNAVIKTFAPALQETLALASANARVAKENKIKVHALRAKAGLWGSNYAGIPVSVPLAGNESRSSFITIYIPVPLKRFWPQGLTEGSDNIGLARIAVEPQNEQLQPGGWVVIDYPKLEVKDADNNLPGAAAVNVNAADTVSELAKLFAANTCTAKGRRQSIHRLEEVEKTNLQAGLMVGFAAKVDLLTLATDKPWLFAEAKDSGIDKLLGCVALLKETIVYSQSEELELAEETIAEDVCGGVDELIELDGLYEGLEAGRWVVVSGERAIAGTSGIRFSELAMLASVSQDIKDIAGGDKLHTFIKLANKLEYCFKRDSLKIYGNVVKATHGETRKEVLGSGDGAKVLQTFLLKQPPLTYVSAANPAGIDSTLKVYVNDVQWQETDALAGLSATERKFITKTDDDGKDTVIFGNGREGARLPTGIENIKAEYRNGIGKPGNVKAGQISLLTSRPLGVKDVINPLPANGGTDKESRDQARNNAPLAVKALDRLVSVQDYQDFARTFAGIGKARAVELSDGARQLVHVTIAGADNIPIDNNADVYRNLRRALLDFGDPEQSIRLEVRELMLIVLEANIRIFPDYLWEPVITQVRLALLDAFSFDRRELGQDVLLSEILSVIQAVRGVAYVDVDILRGIPEKIVDTRNAGERRLLTPGEIANLIGEPLQDKDGNKITEPVARIAVNLADTKKGEIQPAQLAFFTPDVPATLILNQLT
ncbi:MAG: putative baseplate assembly protein [Methylococcaceae bacterium]|nr:putative baseplate assembly protein [Methylococcaceae bacterium]MDP2392038.1 putative baseplate assembly protein [Methylococcaceae bacterium]MDP3020942.1 putative baseplate assembly protein [Methylococcaceae bacterium]MDP3391155.1 putative baseplate assembly protein [Methylococcaceae bacterium]MDP3931698.1 putative baseplate assembly protein [Methylococcaceae bacterium]